MLDSSAALVSSSLPCLRGNAYIVILRECCSVCFFPGNARTGSVGLGHENSFSSAIRGRRRIAWASARLSSPLWTSLDPTCSIFTRKTCSDFPNSALSWSHTTCKPLRSSPILDLNPPQNPPNVPEHADATRVSAASRAAASSPKRGVRTGASLR